MNQITLFSLLASSLAASCLTASARGADPAPAPGAGYPSFYIISERNIFNATRSSRSAGRSQSREPERRIRTETFTLLGTMTYEKGRFAFFDGSAGQFRKVLQPQESIAGFRIAEVAPTCVKLQTTNGQTIELCVGMQMKKREEEDWQLAGRPESPEVASSSSSSRQPSANPEGDSDVLKKLMEQRAKETGDASEASRQPVPAESPKPDSDSSGETDEVVKKLLQKREQELKK
jgi:hypothetical protein